MAARLHALTVLASDPDALALFWRDLLDDSEVPVPLVFKKADLPRSGLNKMHFHLTSYTATQEANVGFVLDPDGNEFHLRRA